MSVHEVTENPSLAALYGRVAATTVLPSTGGALPDDEAVRRDLAIDVDRLAAYAEVCGLRLRDRLPLTYLHLATFPLWLDLVARRAFPFALPGVIHVANRIEQRRAMTITDRPTLRVRNVDLRPHPKGRQFDVVATAEIDGEEIWRDVSTYLHREPGGSGDAEPGPDRPATEPTPTATWQVAKNTGRRYGAVSGDRNPIHLSPLTARLFGFPRAIAHGMWTAARCLGALESRLPEAVTFDVAFKRPLLLPSTVTFVSSPTDGGWHFGVLDRGGAPHLRGAATPR